MAWWYHSVKDRTLVMNPKCASTSMRNSLETVKHIRHRDLMRQEIAICLRDPIERLRSALACSTTPKLTWERHNNLDELLEDMEAGAPIHSHVCRQVDYYNWRILEPGGGTHATVPGYGDKLAFKPAFVFRFERMSEDWPRLAAWLGKEGLELKHCQAAKEPKLDLEPHRERLLRIYAADYRLLDELG